MEKWKDIPRYNGDYQASDRGRIRSVNRKKTWSDGRVMNLSGKLLKTTGHTAGYEAVKIHQKNKLVHRLIAETFLKREKGQNQVNHLDGDKLNNYVTNLEWCTCSHNIKHANDTGLVCKEKLRQRVIWNKGRTSKTDARVSNLAKNSRLLKDSSVVLDLYLNKKYSINKISKKLSCSWDAVKTVLKHNEISIRTISEQKCIDNQRRRDGDC